MNKSSSSLRSYLAALFRRNLLLAWSLVISLAFAAFIGQRYIQQKDSLGKLLAVSAETVDRSLSAGDWDLALRHLQVTLETNGLFGVVVHADNHQRLLGPLGLKPLGAGTICKTLNSTVTVNGCKRALTIDDLIFIGIASLLFTIPLLGAYLTLGKQAESIIVLVEEEIRTFSSADSNSLRSPSKFLELEPIRKIISELLNKTRRIVQAETMAMVSRQVAHDIRSPLSALTFAISSISDIDDEKRALIKNASKRINDIANDLIKNSSMSGKERDDRVNSPKLGALHSTGSEIQRCIENLVAEKQIDLNSNVKIEVELDPIPLELKLPISTINLSRILSNLINNSIESITAAGTIKVSTRVYSKNLVITISDNGSGIPSEILENIGTLGFSYGKAHSGGSGLGLHHAKQIVEGSGGNLSVQSKLGFGTLVTISVPRD